MGIGHRWKIATVRGIPLYVGSSWVGIALLFVFIQYSRLTDSERVTGLEALLLSAFVTVLFFGSVLLHEAAHAVMARGLDLPVMGITLVFWGGATETKAAARGAKGEFLVALVGPATTLALGGVFWVAATLTQGVISDLLDWLARISVIFAALNTVPGFPLDGGRMLLAAVWGITGSRRTGMRIAGYVGLAIGVATIAYAVLSFSQGGSDGSWLFLGYMGFILVTSGRAMDHRIAIRDQLSRGTVAEAMQPPPVTVSADITLVEALDSVLRDAGARSFPVVDGGRLVGTVSLESARKVGARDPMRPVRDGMIPLMQTPTLAADESLDDALEWLGGRQGYVLRDGVLVGSLATDDIERWYRRVIEGRPDPATAVGGGEREPWVPPRPDA
jgi:Zn-dependent protease/predicted transcriptional regulator